MSQPSSRVLQQMGRLVSEVSSAAPRAANAAAVEAKRIQLNEIRRVVGGDLRMSGVGRKGASVGVRYQPSTSGEVASVFVQATGPIHLLERTSRPHLILPRGPLPLRTPYGPRRRVSHPGVRNPRRPWARGFNLAKPAVTKIVQRQYGSAFARGVR